MAEQEIMRDLEAHLALDRKKAELEMQVFDAEVLLMVVNNQDLPPAFRLRLSVDVKNALRILHRTDFDIKELVRLSMVAAAEDGTVEAWYQRQREKEKNEE